MHTIWSDNLDITMSSTEPHVVSTYASRDWRQMAVLVLVVFFGDVGAREGKVVVDVRQRRLANRRTRLPPPHKKAERDLRLHFTRQAHVIDQRFPCADLSLHRYRAFSLKEGSDFGARLSIQHGSADWFYGRSHCL